MRSTADRRPQSMVAHRFTGCETRVVHGFDTVVAKPGPSQALVLRHLNREEIPDGMLLENINSTHTFGMRFKVDVLAMNADWVPLIAVREVDPGHEINLPEATHLMVLPSDWDIFKWESNVHRKDS